MGDVPAERGRQRSARGGPDALCPRPPTQSCLPRSALLPTWETRGRRSWPLALHPCPPPPLLPSRVGCIMGGRLHPSTQGSDNTEQPRGLQGRAPSCCSWGVGGRPETQWGTDQTGGRDPGGGPCSTATVTARDDPPGSGHCIELDSHKPRHSRSTEPCQRTNPSTITGEESEVPKAETMSRRKISKARRYSCVKRHATSTQYLGKPTASREKH